MSQILTLSATKKLLQAAMRNILKNLKLNENTIGFVLGVVVMFLTGFLLINYFRSLRPAVQTDLDNPSNISSLSTDIPATDSAILNLPNTTPTSGPEKLSMASGEQNNQTTIESTVTPMPVAEKSNGGILSWLFGSSDVTPTPEPNLNVEGEKPLTILPDVTTKLSSNSYTLLKGDSLWKIAVKTYGDGYKWKDIYEANKEVLGDNPSIVKAGITLNIPNTTIANESVKYVVKSGDNLWNISKQVCGNGFTWTAIANQNSLQNPRIIQPGISLNIVCPTRK